MFVYCIHHYISDPVGHIDSSAIVSYQHETVTGEVKHIQLKLTTAGPLVIEWSASYRKIHRSHETEYDIKKEQQKMYWPQVCLEYNFKCPENHRTHDDVIKWKHFPRYWPFVRGIHPSPVNSPHKGQ